MVSARNYSINGISFLIAKSYSIRSSGRHLLRLLTRGKFGRKSILVCRCVYLLDMSVYSTIKINRAPLAITIAACTSCDATSKLSLTLRRALYPRVEFVIVLEFVKYLANFHAATLPIMTLGPFTRAHS